VSVSWSVRRVYLEIWSVIVRFGERMKVCHEKTEFDHERAKVSCLWATAMKMHLFFVCEEQN
jgi:hypothetical protein